MHPSEEIADGHEDREDGQWTFSYIEWREKRYGFHSEMVRPPRV